MNIYSVKLPNTLSNDEFHHYLNEISIKKQKKIRRYIRRENAIRTLFGELLIRTIIDREKVTTNNLFSFSYNEYGKPYIQDVSNFHFNISHSGNWVVCATDNKPIGLDIELIKPINLEVAKRFFTAEEYEYIINQPPDNQLSCFYDFWTLKEAYIKAIGKGLLVPLNSFSIKIKASKEFILSSDFLTNSFWLTQHEIDSDYKLSVCSAAPNTVSRIVQIPYTNLISNPFIIQKTPKCMNKQSI